MAALWFLISNTAANLEARRIASGVGFLARDNYLRALAVGLTNTLMVAALGIVGATVLGTLLGLARLARNVLLRRLARHYSL